MSDVIRNFAIDRFAGWGSGDLPWDPDDWSNQELSTEEIHENSWGITTKIEQIGELLGNE